MPSIKVGDRVSAGGSSTGVVKKVDGAQATVRLQTGVTIKLPISRLVVV